MEFFAMIMTMITTKVEAHTGRIIYNLFVEGCKVVVKIISIMEKVLHFDNGSFRRRRTIG